MSARGSVQCFGIKRLSLFSSWVTLLLWPKALVKGRIMVDDSRTRASVWPTVIMQTITSTTTIFIRDWPKSIEGIVGLSREGVISFWALGKGWVLQFSAIQRGGSSWFLTGTALSLQETCKILWTLEMNCILPFSSRLSKQTYISLVFSNARRVLSHRNTRLRLLCLLSNTFSWFPVNAACTGYSQFLYLFLIYYHKMIQPSYASLSVLL